VKKQTLIHILIYGLTGGVLIVTLRLIEFRFLVVEHSIEIYGGLIAALFAGLGIWVGLKLTKAKEVLVVKEVPVPSIEPFALDEQRLKLLGITKRELEILELIGKGNEVREIAKLLHLSPKTVETHRAHIKDKLDLKNSREVARFALQWLQARGA